VVSAVEIIKLYSVAYGSNTHTLTRGTDPAYELASRSGVLCLSFTQRVRVNPLRVTAPACELVSRLGKLCPSVILRALRVKSILTLEMG